MWEAQFGDFANGAQTIVDTYISSAYQKWGQSSSLVMLLPHGYEGHGPDHSSARVERFLQLAAEDNMLIAQPSTPASYFHLLRQQAYARPRRPLVVFTPKQLLRLRAAASPIEDFTSGTFRPVLADASVPPAGVRRVLVSSGRVYYDLLAERTRREDRTTALVRLEQFYPLPGPALAAEIAKYPGADVVWVQDEPQNQGAWSYLFLALPPELRAKFAVVSRPASAATATGSHHLHDEQQAAIIAEAFA
jgi:2-oxoglutarate dehydrogenase E1 component